ncbi:MAG: hypothetical protein QXW94_06885 [Desulfurococcaceae archaeon]
MSDEDLWLQMKRLEMQRRLLAMKAKKDAEGQEKRVEAKDPYKVLEPLLKDRADEVLEAAKAQFPSVADAVVRELARLAEAGGLAEVTGPWLMGLFSRLGYRPRLEARISIISDGKTVDLKDKIAERLREEERR